MNEIRKLLKKFEDLVDQLDTIAQDQRTPRSVLEKLSRLSESQVATSVMMNPSTPSRILEKELKLRPGVGGTDEEARIHISYNPSLSVTILKQLAVKDPAPAVRSSARRALRLRKTIK
jgi:hypothetical protein